MNFSGMATGARILCYMDEFYAFFQVIIVCLRIRSNDAILNFTVVKKKEIQFLQFQKIKINCNSYVSLDISLKCLQMSFGTTFCALNGWFFTTLQEKRKKNVFAYLFIRFS